MFRQCTPLFLAMLCVVVVPTVTSADGPNDVCDSQPTDLADIEIVADWIKSLQYTEESLPSYGAITIHHTPGYVAPNGDVYFRVVPYFSNLGSWGLLQAPVTGRLELAERWITWYLSHLDTNGPPPGVIYDHWYLGDGAGETTCPPGIAPSLCDHDDASDSYAATFLGVAWAYYKAGGNAAFLNAPGNKEKFETVAGVILALQQADGLTWAKDNFHVKFVMDNSEVHWGLTSMAKLEEEIFGDETAAQVYGAAAARVQRGIEQSLFNQTTGLYRVAKFEDETVQEADLNVWYPGTVAIAWPHLLGVTASHSHRARTQMAALNESWDGSPNPDWTTTIVDPSGSVWPSIGHAALLTGDCERARLHTTFVKDQKFPAFDWPFTPADGGWLVMTLSKLAE